MHKTGSSAVTNIVLEREEKREKRNKKKLLQHGVFVFGNKSKYEPRRTGFNFVERTRLGAVFVVL